MIERINPDSDLCNGVAFDVARELLANVAGDAFRHLAALKADPLQSAEAITDARTVAQAAQARIFALRPSDTVAIAAIVGGQ